MRATPSEVEPAAMATPEMFDAISPEPVAASETLRLISLVVAVCSSTAEAMVVWMSLIRPMTAEIWPMASTAPVGVDLDRLDPLRDVLGGLGGLLGELLDLVGDDREALAGLAGAGGLDGRVERQQVGLLGDRGDDLDDLADLGGRLAELGDGAVGRARPPTTASVATRAASLAFWAISRIEAPISSAPVATVCTLRETCSAAAATTWAWALVSSAEAAIWDEESDTSTADDARVSAVRRMPLTTVAMFSTAVLSAPAIWPASSRELTGTRVLRSPAATSSRPARTRSRSLTSRPDTRHARRAPSSRASRATMIVVRWVAARVSSMLALLATTCSSTAARSLSSVVAISKKMSHFGPPETLSPRSSLPSRQSVKIWSL